MTPASYPRHTCPHPDHDPGPPDPLDDRGEPGDLRALVARVLSRPRRRPPAPPARPPAVRPPSRTEV
ncbi:hypothetical protein AB0912_03875 [Streptomyces sp. NPDC007084]|uniref:hypothetical protein n=1 Tax=Streptomyces sp. NPDC007084 TaxID=3154313 RepID=UPI003451F6E3